MINRRSADAKRRPSGVVLLSFYDLTETNQNKVLTTGRELEKYGISPEKWENIFDDGKNLPISSDSRLENIMNVFPGGREFAWLWRSVLCFVIVMGISLTWTIMRFGNLKKALDIYHGEVLSKGVSLTELSGVRPGESKRVEFTIQNSGFQRIRVLGGSSACILHPETTMPFYLEPGEKKQIVFNLLVSVSSTRKTREINTEVLFYTDVHSQSELIFPVVIHLQ